MQMQTGEDEHGTQEHTPGLDRRLVALDITKHLMLTDHRIHHSPLHHRLDFPASKASTMRLLHQL